MAASQFIAGFAQGTLYPTNTNSGNFVTAIREAGFNTVITGLYHIGRDFDINPTQLLGDIYFNDTLVFSGQGIQPGDPLSKRYVGHADWPDLIASLTATSGQGFPVRLVEASIGGASKVIYDFRAIEKIYVQNNQSFEGTNLQANFQAMKQVIPTINFIDMDNEETSVASCESFVAFCQMLTKIGYDLTFCPYTDVAFWNEAEGALNTTTSYPVKWWNLQCYDGGGWNRELPNFISTWAGSDTKFVLGDWTNDKPSDMLDMLTPFAAQNDVIGGFLWTLDDAFANSTLPDYAQAIQEAFPA
jgi:hypothetical protein